ncbi:MAG: 3-isopropylmalate dehydratase small subunit [Candidatus Hydrogenedentes bacterium]|nr:3-isopropylmalate dehydratase small subunit [Candidatus Hydrogenedentota bacterium]
MADQTERDNPGIAGRTWKFGDNVNTDEIIPAKYLNTSDPQELAEHCMEGIDERFPREVKPGDIIVAGENFGCGSSREHAPVCIKAAGVGCVIAASFARIFCRNAINMALPIFECPEASADIEAGDRIEVAPATGQITNVTRNVTYNAAPFPEFMRELIAAGGLMPWVKKKTENE